MQIKELKVLFAVPGEDEGDDAQKKIATVTLDGDSDAEITGVTIEPNDDGDDIKVTATAEVEIECTVDTEETDEDSL